MTLIPLTDTSRRPTRFPAMTIAIILLNAFVFALELVGGDAFVQQWSVIPADIAGEVRYSPARLAYDPQESFITRPFPAVNGNFPIFTL